MRRSLALAAVAAAVLAAPAAAEPKAISCFREHGTELYFLVNCIHPIVPKGAADAPAVDVVKCVTDHNRIPDPGYGGWVIEPKDTVNCIHPIVP